MKFNKVLFPILFLLGTLLALPSLTPDEKELQWHAIANLPDLQSKAPKKVLIDVYTDWCKWCKVMDEKTFSDEDLQAYLREGYHLVKFNAEERQPIAFRGATYSFQGSGQRGYHQLAAKLLDGRLGYPSLVILDEELAVTKVIRGYKDAPSLRAELEREVVSAGR